jgi:MioC protein
MSVVILYGSETGTAELVSDAISDVLTEHHDVSMYDMSEFDVEDLSPDDFYVIVCSTYGEGELPTGAEPFAEGLDDTAPTLDGVRFALFGLGDSVYDDTFNRGGEIIAEKLTDLGATQVGEHGRHDASSKISPKAQATDWAEQISKVISPALH